MERLRPYPITVFAGVTVLIWGNRVWLAWTDSSLEFAAKLGYSVPITCFVLAGVATLILSWRRATESAGFRSWCRRSPAAPSSIGPSASP